MVAVFATTLEICQLTSVNLIPKGNMMMAFATAVAPVFFVVVTCTRILVATAHAIVTDTIMMVLVSNVEESLMEAKGFVDFVLFNSRTQEVADWEK